MAEGEFYWCLRHGTVEPYEGCKQVDRLGPYPTREQAGRALERVAERNERWEDDPDWDDDADERG